MNTPAEEVTSLLLGWKAEDRDMEQGRVKRVWLELRRRNPLRTMQLKSGGARHRPCQKLESQPCHQ